MDEGRKEGFMSFSPLCQDCSDLLFDLGQTFGADVRLEVILSEAFYKDEREEGNLHSAG